MNEKKSFYNRLWTLFKPFHRHFGVVFVLLLISQLVGSVNSYFLGKSVELFSQIGLKTVSSQLIGLMLGGSCVAWLIIVAIEYFRDQYERKHLDFEIGGNVSKISLKKYLSLSLGQHINQHSSISQQIVNAGQSALQAAIQTLVYELFPNIIQITVSIGVLFFVHWSIGLVMLANAVMFWLIMYWLNKWSLPRIEGMNKLNRTFGKAVSEIYRNIKLVTMESQQERSTAGAMLKREEMTSYGKDFWQKFWNRILVLRLSTGGVRYVLYILCAYLIWNKVITGGMFVLVFLWSNNALNSMHVIGNLWRRFAQSVADIKKYFEMLDTEPTVKTVENPIRLKDIKGMIEFKNIHFKYPMRKKTEEDVPEDEESDGDGALKGINFLIYPGQKIGIVGESGSGKSTMVHLLSRAFDPDDGQILIDGNDLRLVDLLTYRQQIGNVDQQIQLFDISIKDNILYGLSDSARQKITEEELEEIAEISCINKFRDRLEHGLDTMIGEHGVKLSGGERQRIAIARALVKKPKIMIFDEATASLDSKNERLIQDAIDKVSKNRTCIIIAHRLSTIKNADNIFVFKKGEIVGEGTHDELMANCEYYSSLVHEQLTYV